MNLPDELLSKSAPSAVGPAVEEYLRRNLLVAKAIGAYANARALLERVQSHKRPPKWLVADLACLAAATEGIIERLGPVAGEMARHRDEIGGIP